MPLDPNVVMERLDHQILWYDRASIRNRKMFRRITAFEILAALTITVSAALNLPHFREVTIVLGALFTAAQALLHLNQYQQNWLIYRSTCEFLKHEKYTYLAGAGPYAHA